MLKLVPRDLLDWITSKSEQVDLKEVFKKRDGFRIQIVSRQFGVGEILLIRDQSNCAAVLSNRFLENLETMKYDLPTGFFLLSKIMMSVFYRPCYDSGYAIFSYTRIGNSY